MYTVHCRDAETAFSTPLAKKYLAEEFALRFVMRNRERNPHAEVRDKRGNVVARFRWDAALKAPTSLPEPTLA